MTTFASTKQKKLKLVTKRKTAKQKFREASHCDLNSWCEGNMICQRCKHCVGHCQCQYTATPQELKAAGIAVS